MKWKDQIIHYDSLSIIERIAAYWALVELYVKEKSLALNPKIVGFRYKDLRGNPETMCPKIIKLLGKNICIYKKNLMKVVSESSVTTGPKRNKLAYESRFKSWEIELNKKDITIIE